MNPSYSNGSGSNAAGQQTPGVKPGVIASGPDLEDAPTIPVGTPNKPMSLGGSGRSRVSSLLGKVKSSKPAPSQPIQFGGGGGEKKSKKGLIIGALAVVVILVVVLVVVMMMGGGKSGGNVSSDDAFNKLINYITSGNVSNTKITSEYDGLSNYYFLNGWDTEEQKKEVYDETKNLMDKFAAIYKDSDNSTLNNLVKSTKEQFDFIYAMDSAEKTYGTETIMTIVKDGGNKAKQKLIDRYTFSDLAENSYAKKFLEIYTDFLDTTIANVNIYRENGCLNNNYINAECMESKNKDGLQDTDTLYANVVHYYNLTDSFVGNIYHINDLLQGKTDTEKENE